MTNEVVNYQNHQICNECKYDSHCAWLVPGTLCDTPASPYIIGNPLTPTI